MRLQNTTAQHINIFQGMGIPGNTDMSVAADMEQQVRSSALVADYVKSGKLAIIETVVAETVIADVPVEGTKPQVEAAKK